MPVLRRADSDPGAGLQALRPRGRAGLTPADRLAGCLLGQALGDALGFVVEARPADEAGCYVERWLRVGRAGERAAAGHPFGQYTDDTQLARELLRSVADTGGWDPEAFARRVAALFAAGRDVGAGPGSRAAAGRLADGMPWTRSGTPAPYAGNGAAMRAAPLGPLFAADEATMRRAAREQSLVTHRDPRCAAGAVAVAAAAALAARPGPLDAGAFLAQVGAWAGAEEVSVGRAVADLALWRRLPPEQAVGYLGVGYLDGGPAAGGGARRDFPGVSSLTVPTVLWSLYSFLRSPDDYWETVCTAIAVGGDTDTMAAMAGAMSGARLGPQALPEELVARLTDRGEWEAVELAALARSLIG